MAKLGINTGSSANDGTGDGLRLGGGKVNANFDEIYSAIGDGTTLRIGTGSTCAITVGESQVGIGSTIPAHLLDVRGGIGATNISISGISTFSGDATFSSDVTFSDDVTFTGGSYNVLWDKSQNSLEFSDEAKSVFGNNRDLMIYHTQDLSGQNDSNGDSVLDGNNWCTYIKEDGTGGLVFKSDGAHSTGAYQFYDTGWRPILKLFSGGSNSRASLYADGTVKLATSSTGVDITGSVTMNSAVVGSAVTIAPTGINVAGVSTFAGTVSAQGLTSPTITATTSTLVGSAVTTDSGGIRVAGVVTATSFIGKYFDGTVIGDVQVGTSLTAYSHGVVTSGIVTAQGGFITGSGTTAVQMSISGNNLLFTVVGIGTTHLVLVP
mgnify:CR=1 FL=1